MSLLGPIVYPPTIDYDYLLQRPQQLLKSLSQLEIPSLFFNCNIFFRPKGIRKISPLFYVLNDVNIKAHLAKVRPIVYFTLPEHVNIVNEYNPSLVIFDSIDEPSEEFSSWHTYYHTALKRADIVLATSEKLYRTALTFNSETHLVPNGCDFHFFNQASKKNLRIPEDIRSIKKPIIGFIGAVATWVDFGLIDRLARTFPNCSIVMIGPYLGTKKLPAHPNLHWLGGKPYQQLIAYAQLFDVGIIPFRTSSMTEAVNPIKMWEYMATGMPVVTTAIPEARKYSHLLLYSENEEQFMENIKNALYNDTVQKREQRMALAMQNSWTRRAEQIKGIIERKLGLQSNVLRGAAGSSLKGLIQMLDKTPQYIGNVGSVRSIRISGPAFRYRTERSR